MASRPRVSIGVAIYNEAKFLRSTLDSVLAQDFTDFELIISDNASTDGTQEISLEYVARDPRVSYHRNETNVGATENFNLVFKYATGEYFMWMGGHDLCAPNYVSRCLAVLESDPALVQCNSVTQHMSQEGRELGRALRQVDTRGKSIFVRANLILWQVSNFDVYSLFRTDALKRTRLLCRVAGPDFLLGYELALLGTTAIIPEPLYFMRDNRAERLPAADRVTRKEDLQERLYPKGTPSAGRFPHLRYLMEVMRAVKLAPLPWWLRIALWLSIPPSDLFRFYPYVPEFIRRPVRGWLSHRLKAPS